MSHVLGALFLLFLASLPDAPTRPAADPATPLNDIVWIAQPGPGGGGGGGGNKMPDPPRRTELPAKDKITVPVAKPPAKVAPPKPEEPKPEQQITIPAAPMASGIETVPGAINALPIPTPSQGSGTGGGDGTGRGTGSGPGSGSGLGPGTGGGFGGGAYRPGNGITNPELIRNVKPNYTAEAMRAKVQGLATLEAVVLADGSVGDVRILRSLDPTFGLDQEAIRTVKKWLFRPGTNSTGQAVATLVEIELSFTLR